MTESWIRMIGFICFEDPFEIISDFALANDPPCESFSFEVYDFSSTYGLPRNRYGDFTAFYDALDETALANYRVHPLRYSV